MSRNTALASRPRLLIVHPYVAHLYGHMAEDFDIIRYWEADDGPAFLQREGKGIRALLSLPPVGPEGEVAPENLPPRLLDRFFPPKAPESPSPTPSAGPISAP